MKLLLSALLFFILSFDAFAQATNGVVVLPDPAVSPNYLKARYAIAIDKNDNVWVGYRYIGLGKFANGSWTMYDSISNGLLSNTVYAVAVDASNNIWIGTKNGLQKFDGTTFQSYTTANSGLLNNLVTTIFIKGSSVYIGTKSGISIFDGNNWTAYTTANSGLVADSITAITVTDNNDKYFATFKGLSCLTSTLNWITYDSASASIENKIYALLADTNSVYIGTEYTSYKLSNNDIEPVENVSTCPEDRHFPTYSFAKTSAGKIYFGTSTYTLYEMQGVKLKKYVLSPAISRTRYAVTSKDSLFLINGIINGPNGFQKFEPDLYKDPENTDSTAYIDINEVKALITNAGGMHWDYENLQESKYFVPKCSGNKSV